MSVINERRRKRYAEDPKFRKQRLAVNNRWRKRNKEKISAQKKDYWRSLPPEQRARIIARIDDRHIRRVYGLTRDDYADMLASQHGRCRGCLKPFTAFKRRLAVDHCHATGAIRGLLCNKCNAGLGCFDDDPDRMIRMADYIVSRDEATRSSVLAPAPVTLPMATPARPLAPRPIFAARPSTV
jgi:recombination endonuclease VII